MAHYEEARDWYERYDNSNTKDREQRTLETDMAVYGHPVSGEIGKKWHKEFWKEKHNGVINNCEQRMRRADMKVFGKLRSTSWR